MRVKWMASARPVLAGLRSLTHPGLVSRQWAQGSTICSNLHRWSGTLIKLVSTIRRTFDTSLWKSTSKINFLSGCQAWIMVMLLMYLIIPCSVPLRTWSLIPYSTYDSHRSTSASWLQELPVLVSCTSQESWHTDLPSCHTSCDSRVNESAWGMGWLHTSWVGWVELSLTHGTRLTAGKLVRN